MDRSPRSVVATALVWQRETSATSMRQVSPCSIHGQRCAEDTYSRADWLLDWRRLTTRRDARGAGADGTISYAAATATSEQILTVLRTSVEGTSLVAVNVASEPVSCEVRLPRELSTPRVRDHWNDEWIDVPAGSRSLSLAFAPFQPRVVRLEAPDDQG